MTGLGVLGDAIAARRHQHQKEMLCLPGMRGAPTWTRCFRPDSLPEFQTDRGRGFLVI